MLRLFLFLAISFCVSEAYSQSPVYLNFRTKDYLKVTKKIPSVVANKKVALDFLKNLQLEAIKKGYLGASVDSLSYQQDTLSVSFNTGKRYSYLQLNTSKETIDFIKKNSHLSEKILTKSSVNPTELSRLLKQILLSLNSNGYPFAQCYLENLTETTHELTADLTIQKGALFQLSEIHVKGDSAISTSFISTLIDLKIGELYDETKLAEISKKIAQLTYLKEIKPFELLFTDHGFEIYLYLKSVPLSSLNGVVGLQQNDQNKPVSFTGELDLKLLNTLKRGEQINLNWRSIQAQTQNLKASINYPFLFKSRFGVDGQFHLYKRDTTFLELKTTVGIQYALNSGSLLSVFYQNSTSSRIGGSSNNPLFTNLSSVNTNAYGISYSNRLVDYLPNPTKGRNIQASIAIGNRSAQNSDTSKTIQSTTVKGSIKLEFYFPITARNVFHLSSKTDFYLAPIIYQNEVFRFGGQTSLRGFNEEELYGTTTSILSLEYRFLLDKNSNLFAFYDQALMENNAANYYKDAPFGFGIGLSFGTKIGIFSISYALGKQFNNPVLLSNGKVHFGYIAYF
jgi:outer membrane protein assembly factor BamA